MYNSSYELIIVYLIVNIKLRIVYLIKVILRIKGG